MLTDNRKLKMKRLLSYIVLPAAALALACCSREQLSQEPFGPGDGRGSAAISLGVQSTRAGAAESYPWNCCTISIYKYTDAGGRELIRRYESLADMPGAVWLLAGRYAIAAEVGSGAGASFDEPTYYGEADFEIVAGRSTSVKVECPIVNTIVEVEYDESVARTFDIDYVTKVAIADTFDDNAQDGQTLSLTYESAGRGYFIIPADAASLSYCFEGHSSNQAVTGSDGEAGQVHEHFTKALQERREGMRYLLRLKYSPDLGGHLDWDFEIKIVEPTPEDNFGVLDPSPEGSIELTITGEGVEEPYKYMAGEVELKISGGRFMNTITITDGEYSVEIPCEEPYDEEGISTSFDVRTDITLKLGARFFERFAGGEHRFTVTAVDLAGKSVTAHPEYLLQGVVSLTPTDRWFARGSISAMVFDPSAGDVQVRYRTLPDGGWSQVAARPGEGDVWTADCEGINANTEYEYQLLIDSQSVNASLTSTTGDGSQIYNSGFEIWTGTSPLLPYTDDSDQWWDTGNHGSSTLRKNVTTDSADVRPYSPGTKSAMLQSQFVSLVVGKFAAGNMFIGKYLGTSGTNGVIGFGKPFEYTYRPKSLRFWYKGTVGTVDYAGGGVKTGDRDVAQFYVLLCSNITGPHIVDTRYEDTFMKLDELQSGQSTTISYCPSPNGVNSSNTASDGHVVAYAVWENQQSYDDWTMIELTLKYNSEYEAEVPTYLMLTASSSKYGDYFAGSTSSVMYLDDVEFVY